MNIPLEKAFEIWIQLTEVDPESQYSYKNSNVISINKEVKETIELDDTLVTTLLLLRYHVKQYLSNKYFSVIDILNADNKYNRSIELSKKLLDIIYSVEADEYATSFYEDVLTSFQHYGVDLPEVANILERPDTLSLIRRDALKSMKELEILQFTQGATDKDSKAVYFKNVYQFSNINSLLKHLSQSEKSGVSLNMIQEPNKNPYFAFAVRNGGTISVLTDRPKYAYPTQSKSQRRPGRDFSERMYRNHFPYSLKPIHTDTYGDSFLFEPSSTLAVIQEEIIKLEDIKNLKPNEVVWIFMMFELIENKFWKENYKTKELTYTAEMIKFTSPAKELSNQLALTDYQFIESKELSSSDVRTDKLIEDWDDDYGTPYQWIEDRYEHLVKDEFLNLSSNSGSKTLYIEEASTSKNDVKIVNSQELRESLFYNSNTNIVRLEAMNPSQFGTKEELLKDQRWYARYNKVKLLEGHLNEEFNNRHEEIAEWYKQAVINNLDTLFERIVDDSTFNKLDYVCPESESIPVKLSIRHVNNFDVKSSVIIGNKKICAVTSGASSFKFVFEPKNIDGLAYLAGCEVSDLPDILQHWTLPIYHKGNSILNRLDPLNWALSNPWEELSMNISIYMSKRGYVDLSKKYNFVSEKFWMDERFLLPY